MNDHKRDLSMDGSNKQDGEMVKGNEMGDRVTIEVWPPRTDLGGQHVGTGPSGVKVTHHASGITATVEIARSQHINRMIAMDMIESAITHPQYRL